MSQVGTSAEELSDAQLVAAMEELTLPKHAFRHRDHLRLAWLNLRQARSLELAGEQFSQTLRKFAAHHGVPEKYHHTITMVWMRLIAAAMRLTPHVGDFTAFAMAHPFLFDVKLPWAFYSSEQLSSANARTGWIEPDLHRLP
ncbi:MAG TPA: hypothetical protein VEU31_08905 [Candidatus Acidoferrales bacterium]|nr:hypothetical protein [Candidatus Acidoferrales bacterium]